MVVFITTAVLVSALPVTAATTGIPVNEDIEDWALMPRSSMNGKFHRGNLLRRARSSIKNRTRLYGSLKYFLRISNDRMTGITGDLPLFVGASHEKPNHSCQTFIGMIS